VAYRHSQRQAVHAQSSQHLDNVQLLVDAFLDLVDAGPILAVPLGLTATGYPLQKERGTGEIARHSDRFFFAGRPFFITAKQVFVVYFFSHP
jgi:hypothetical protein